MAITFIGSVKGASDFNDITLTLPAMNQNDLVLVVAGTGRRTAGSPVSVPGYTVLTNTVTGSGTSPGQLVAYKRMGASPDGTVFITGTGSSTIPLAAIAMVFRGVHTTTAVEDFAIDGDSAGPTVPNPIAMTPTVNNCCIVIGAANTGTDTTVGSVTSYLPSPTVQQDAHPISGSLDVTVASAYRILTGGASVSQDPAAWSTWTGGAWLATTVILAPGITTETITVTQASVVVAGKTVTVGTLQPVPVTQATVTSAGKTVTVREFDVIPVAKATTTLAGKGVAILAAGIEAVAVDKASVTLAGKTVTIADTAAVITVNKAVFALVGKPLTLLDRITINKATVAFAGGTVTRVTTAFEHSPKYTIHGRGSRHAIKGRGSRTFLVISS